METLYIHCKLADDIVMTALLFQLLNTAYFLVLMSHRFFVLPFAPFYGGNFFAPVSSRNDMIEEEVVAKLPFVKVDKWSVGTGWR